MAEKPLKEELEAKRVAKEAVEKAKPAEEKIVRTRGNIIRVVETNLDGGKPVEAAIGQIRGIGPQFSHAISEVSGFGGKNLQDLSPDEMTKLVDIIQHPEKFSIPSWMFNRRRDPLKGIDRHLTASSLDLTKKMDIDSMKRLKVYKGVRHSLGLPVRGQRTRSSFRKGKTVGVKREKQAPAKAAEGKKEK